MLRNTRVTNEDRKKATIAQCGKLTEDDRHLHLDGIEKRQLRARAVPHRVHAQRVRPADLLTDRVLVRASFACTNKALACG